MDRNRVALVGAVSLLVLPAGPSAAAFADCVPVGAEVSVQQVAARVEREGLRFLFVGERHAVGPVKRFAVDLAHELAGRGHDVGLYVEGFRTDCPPADVACDSLARLFNAEAFRRLLDESRVPVHAIDPPEEDRRAARMADAIAAGSESIRVVLVGNSHVAHAGDPRAELWVYGGAMRYPDPGDLAEAFPREESLIVALETAEPAVAPPYALLTGGCGVDYTLVASNTPAYGRPGRRVGRRTAPSRRRRAGAGGSGPDAHARLARPRSSPSRPGRRACLPCRSPTHR